MKELKNLRKRNEKHFLNKDGTISAYLYNNDIYLHYYMEDQYKHILSSPCTHSRVRAEYSCCHPL